MRSPRSLRSKDGMGIKGRERKRERGGREREKGRVSPKRSGWEGSLGF